MANTLKLGNGKWATGKDTLMSFSDTNNNFKPLPFDFSRASSATVVNQSGLIETVGSGEPRIDFLGNTKGALLLEPQRTNLITYSEDFSSFTQNGCSVISDDISFTLGGLADKIQEDSSNSNKHIRPANISIISGQSYIMSAWFKSDNCDVIALREGSSSGDSITYKFSTGTTSTTGTRWTTLNVVNFSNGWRRIDAKYTSTSTASMNFRVHLLGNNYSQVTNPNPSTYTYQGNGTSGVYMWGLTVEQGSYPTSYIPTSGQSGGVTRVAESSSQTVPDGIYGTNEVTFVIDFEINGDTPTYSSIFNTNKNTASSFGATRQDENGRLKSFLFSSGVNVGDMTSTTAFLNGVRGKFAVGYKNGDSVLVVKGNVEDTNSATFSDFNVNEIHLNDLVTYFGYHTNLKIYDFKLYNTRLSNAELASLTTI